LAGIDFVANVTNDFAHDWF